MADPGAPSTYESLNEAVLKLQRSARQTLPMFAIGIFATLIAAGVAIYYIMTLSTDVREARTALQNSEMALAQARENLAAVNSSLRDAQTRMSSSTRADTIATAISDVSRSQRNINVASSSIRDATAKLTPNGGGEEAGGFREMVGTCRLVVNTVTHLDGRCEIEMSRDGSFRIYPVGRTGPSASITRNGSAGLGSWRAAPGEAMMEVGTLRRSGACWSNEMASICAWA